MEFSKRDRLRLLGGAAALALGACSGGGSRGRAGPLPSPPSPPSSAPAPRPSAAVLRDVYAARFPVGAAIRQDQIAAATDERALLEAQFSSITAEYEMKPDIIAPTGSGYDFSRADALVDWAEANGIAVRGHALLWHQTTPAWFLSGSPGDIRDRLQTYVTDVVSRYRGRIQAWDVVNEVISDSADGTAPYRNSNWYQAVGSADFIDWAFEAARAADPDCKLFINDYNTELPDKRSRLLQVVQDLVSRGVPVDGVGHQFHLQIDDTPADVLAAIDAVDALGLGLENHATEIDVSVYSDPGECFDSGVNCSSSYGSQAGDVPDSVYADQARLYRGVFRGLAQRSSVTSVSVWGAHDGQTWLNRFPVSRSNFPLLFDADLQPKPAFHAVTDPDYEI